MGIVGPPVSSGNDPRREIMRAGVGLLTEEEAMENRRGLLRRAADAVQADLQGSREARGEVADAPAADAPAEIVPEPAAAPPVAEAVMMSAEGVLARFEYKVDVVKEKLISDKISSSSLQELLNRRAREGWQVKAITETTVSRAGSTGLMVTFERPVES